MSKRLTGAIAAALVLAGTMSGARPAVAQQASNSYAFIKAVKERDGNKVTDLLAAPGSIYANIKEPGTGDGPLHILARGRDINWMAFLISKGSRVDQQNARGETPLGIAAQLGWTEGAELLLKQRSSVDLANSRGETPLILAVQRRDVPMVRLLLSRGANPKRTDSVAGRSALDYARQDSRAATIVKMLEAPVANAARPVQGPKL